jgi:hypothetical protein
MKLNPCSRQIFEKLVIKNAISPKWEDPPAIFHQSLDPPEVLENI